MTDNVLDQNPSTLLLITKVFSPLALNLSSNVVSQGEEYRLTYSIIPNCYKNFIEQYGSLHSKSNNCIRHNRNYSSEHEAE